MYKIIFLSSSILILSPIFIILLKKYCKNNNLNYVPQLKKVHLLGLEENIFI